MQDLLDILSITGGVPKYLEEVDPSIPAEENIRQLCFTREGILFRDFNQIFNQLFGAKTESRKVIMRAVAYGSKSVAEIAERMGVERNGHLAPSVARRKTRKIPFYKAFAGSVPTGSSYLSIPSAANAAFIG